VLVLGLVSGCTFPTSGVSDDVVTVDASTSGDASSVDADPTAPDAACTPGCDGDTLITCQGNMPVETDCELGCALGGGPHCAEMVPSNLSDAADLTGVSGPIALTAGDKYTLYTDTGQIQRNDGTDLRAAGANVGGTIYRQINPGLAVLAVSTFFLADDTPIAAYGDRALIILASGPVQIDGSLDFSAGCDLGGGFTARCGGPGGGNGGSPTAVLGDGCAPGAGGSSGSPENGGAGGGFASMGGNGGDVPGKTAPAASPLTSCADATLIPLRGGSGGGAGTGSGNSVGGGGGGSLQVTSLTSITVGTSGASSRPMFYMAGAGGEGPGPMANRGGGGGGSGGALLLEAPTVTIVDAVVITSGGGGAGGRVINLDGAWGPSDGSPATGGLGDGGGGAGGNGATPTVTVGVGGASADGSGGGGGGYGRFRVNTAAGGFVVPPVALVTAATSSGPVARN